MFGVIAKLNGRTGELMIECDVVADGVDGRLAGGDWNGAVNAAGVFVPVAPFSEPPLPRGLSPLAPSLPLLLLLRRRLADASAA